MFVKTKMPEKNKVSTKSSRSPKPSKKEKIKISSPKTEKSISDDKKKLKSTSKSTSKSESKPDKKKSKKTEKLDVENVYEGMTHHQHILFAPDTYIGTTDVDEVRMFVYDEDTGKIIEDVINYVAGFFKIFDEILVNARDHTVRDKTCKNIYITIDKQTGRITVWNDGNGIPVAIHKKYNIYVPEMIFANLLTSQNYGKKGKTVGGKNGYGAKLTNIYSKEFTIHTIGADKIREEDGKIVPDDKAKKVEYRQVFKNNMYEILPPEINHKISQGSKMFTEISYLPDYERFGMNGLTNDMYRLLLKRCYDVAACTPKSVNIVVNDEPIKCRDFKDYIKMYYQDDTKEKPKITHEKVNSRWEVGIGFNKNVGDRCVSFVNGISTFQGGTHVSHVVNNVVAGVIAYIEKELKKKKNTKKKDGKKKENTTLKIMPATVKQYLTFFINCVVEDPSFNSQTKEFMNSKMSAWCVCGNNCADVRCEFSEKFIEDLCDTGLMTEVIKMSEFKEMRDLVKTDGKKIGKITIEKLMDADMAGGRNAHKCSIFFTEGDSARSFAVSGIGVIGNDLYGVFPLKGKLLNVRNANAKQIKANQEFICIKQILGLKQGMRYKDVSRLRYGSVIILTDQDPDGSHIKGLIINMLEYFWPDLLQIKGFIKAYNTPIVKAWKKDDKKKKNIKMFYSISECEEWKEKLGDTFTRWDYKYYKGLGTSTQKEAKESFYNFNDNLATFVWDEDNDDSIDDENKEARQKEIAKLKTEMSKKTDDKESKKSKKSKKKTDEENEDNENGKSDEDENKGESDEGNEENSAKDIDDDELYAYMRNKSHMAITKAFDETKVYLRKEWLQKLKRNNTLEYKPGMILTYSDFIDKDLIFFSNLDNDRSIPSICDGQKPGQRMIMFCCFKRGRKSKEVKVAQLSGYVSENTDYHHGEASLQGTIIGLAQNFPGSNNINLLKPNGNFGYRRQGGKDHASARYIFTELDPITNFIYREEDDEILEYNYSGKQKVEPTFYAPIIPMILINGAKGIGTGFSTTIPPHNPRDVVTNLKRRINDDETIEMVPWFNGFKGTIEPVLNKPGKYVVKGKYVINGETVTIEDIPIVNGWIEPYEMKMEEKVSVSKDDGNKIQHIKKNPGNNKINMVITFKGQELQKMYKAGTVEKFLRMSQNLSVSNLNLFNAEGKMTKYDSVDAIMRDFYDFRLSMYEKRREYYLLKLQNDVDIASYKVKFIKEYLAGTILIAKKTEEDVLNQLNTKGYPKLSYDHRVPEASKSYAYLTSMSIMSLTTTKIKELENNIEICQTEYDMYFNTSIKKIWLKELDEFSKAYDIWCQEWESENELNDKADPDSNGRNEGGKRKRTRKGKKSKDTDDDGEKNDDEENNEPIIKVSKKSKSKKSKSDDNDIKKVVRKRTKK
jgi:DNA topoisomerase-2